MGGGGGARFQKKINSNYKVQPLANDASKVISPGKNSLERHVIKSLKKRIP